MKPGPSFEFGRQTQSLHLRLGLKLSSLIKLTVRAESEASLCYAATGSVRCGTSRDALSGTPPSTSSNCLRVYASLQHIITFLPSVSLSLGFCPVSLRSLLSSLSFPPPFPRICQMIEALPETGFAGVFFLLKLGQN